MSVETQLAVLEAKVTRLDKDIETFAPVLKQVDEIQWTLNKVKEEVSTLAESFENFKREQKSRDETTRKQKYIVYGALIGLVGTFLSSTAAVLTSIL